MKVKKGDNVLIISGKDKNKKAKILRVFPDKGLVLVEGINLKKKNQKPKKQGEKGQVILLPAPLAVSNVKLVCPKCGKAARIGFKMSGEQKSRVCKKCRQEI
jgi:large subunit ribosomal protein L24